MIKAEIYDWLAKLVGSSPKVEQIIINTGFTGLVLEDKNMGIAMNVRSGDISDNVYGDYLRGLIGMEALPAAENILNKMEQFKPIYHNNHLMNSILIALYNALSKPFMNKGYLGKLGCAIEYPDMKATGFEGVNPDDILTIVGFGGMVRPLSSIAKETYVTELNPELFISTLISSRGVEKGPNCCRLIRSDEAGLYFKKADTVYITGSALVTDTMEEILEQCFGKKVVLYGATAGFLPQPLLKRGVHIIRSLEIEDSALMVELLLNCAGAVERFFPMAARNMVIKTLSPL